MVALSNLTVDEELVREALFHQAVQKAPGIDRLKFQALREWDSPRIVALARQCFRLGLHPPSVESGKGRPVKETQ
jgi:hypothetical protein